MIRGKAWVYGDDIDTDVIIPGKYLIRWELSLDAQISSAPMAACFSSSNSRRDLLFGR